VAGLGVPDAVSMLVFGAEKAVEGGDGADEVERVVIAASAATAFSNLDVVLITIFDRADDEKLFKLVDAVDLSMIVFILSGLVAVR